MRRAPDEVCVRVTAPPDGGKANKAVCKLVAEALGVPKSRVGVASGHTARRKRLSVEADQAQVDALAGISSALLAGQCARRRGISPRFCCEFLKDGDLPLTAT